MSEDDIGGGLTYIETRNKIAAIREARLAEVIAERDALRAQVERTKTALKPFADFADPCNTIPPDTILTAGSPMARKQITMANCYAAKAALSSDNSA